ncbi:MAG: hypothetical protein N0C84_00840 [Candidatus Thiodiazotropha taylori]|uniref:Uncharacterized protein n=1 Tax=Candidatus Thiodiazotropha taylori TaxID=2792791 RepID=A0A9E4N226_9GAMM|nr:hypothetical protein [Candidatus Thiodiazotropha taylori]MCW4254991.1 hypothetical protein [Candidatus Thiodiazotropha taylori]
MSVEPDVTLNDYEAVVSSVEAGERRIGTIIKATDDSEIYIVVPKANNPFKQVPIPYSRFLQLRQLPITSISDKATQELPAITDMLTSVLSPTGLNLDGYEITSSGLVKSDQYTTAKTAYGLTAPSGAQCLTGQRDPGIPYTGIRATSYAPTSSDSTIPANGLNQPGRTEGTRVLCANPDPTKVPKQNIITSLDEMCKELDITVQITYNGGWVGRATGTKNHPLGDAADIQLVRDGAIIRPINDPATYTEIVQTLLKNAKANSIRPGIGGYPGFIHYDESPWRQRPSTGNALADACGHWNSGFRVTEMLFAVV